MYSVAPCRRRVDSAKVVHRTYGLPTPYMETVPATVRLRNTVMSYELQGMIQHRSHHPNSNVGRKGYINARLNA